MNCKPNDIAIVVRASSPKKSRHIGAIVTVTVFDIDRDGWRFKDCPSIALAGYTVIDDAILRPIRPGDLEDETPESIIKEQTCEHQ